MDTEGPYTYPLTDRADIIKFLGEHQSYWPMNSNNGGFVLAWNIKVRYNFDTSGAAYRDGRSGGWMVLTDWFGPTPNAFRSCPMSWEDGDHYLDWLDQRSDVELEVFYKAIVQLDQDLSRDNCRKEIEYQYAFRREQWEEEQVAVEERAARKLEASRPDMYPQED